MPCWEVRTMSVEFKAKNIELLKKAITALKWKYEQKDQEVYIGGMVINLKTQKAEVNDYDQYKLNRLKQEYSWQAVQAVAKKKAWNISGSKKAGVIRRY